MSSKTFASFAVVLFAIFTSLSALASSNVRIVRLSFVEGSVQIDRNTGKYEKAFSNFPIVEGAKVRAQSDSRAEVEFEDGSTLRIVPNTTVQFPELSLDDSGTKLSTVEVLSGTAYLKFAGNKDNSMTLVFGREKVALNKSTHVRVSVDDKGADLAVLKGDIQVEAPSGTTQVKKNQTATFDAAENKLALVKDVQELPFDAWDKQQGEYHERYNVNSYGNSSGYSYGMADLNYYGNFFSAPGYGMMWQPYFIGAGWDPFMDGAWAFTPGYGYGWVSSYPWGWTPYHSGTWVFLSGYGWAWQPGGVWSPFYTPQVLNPPAGFTAPHAPTSGTTTVVTNHSPASVNGLRGDKMVIRNNSAGLGVPRGEIKNLGKISEQVQQRGEVTQRTHPAPVAMPTASAMSARPGPGSAANSRSTSSRTASGPSAPSMSTSSGPSMSSSHGGPSAPSGHR